MCPFVLGFEAKVNDVEVSKKNRAEKLCEYYLVHQIQQRIPKLWIQIFTIFFDHFQQVFEILFCIFAWICSFRIIRWIR